MTNVVEIAVQDVAGVRIAQAAGADRVELCVALAATGGLTPPIGLIEVAVATGLPIHPLVRSRPGGFCYDGVELDVLVRDVRAAVRAGAAGVVVGALTPDWAVDVEAIRALVDAAGGAGVTFHRALDVVADARGALDLLAELGVTRVLTSGAAQAAIDGRANLELLAAHAASTGGRVQVMAGGGVRVQDIGALFGAGVDAVHLSARRAAPGAGASGPGGGPDGYDMTDESIVRAAVQAARSAPASG
ncbi:copper homeostasis protein CutC [Pengzhenrongella sicca]|uniref:PF03932 family protein CutC n=1 Tax=Pengzhenrongella sicca TaxID=2819238 RepID=A0A8A4ZGL2_9MICO|nr:copper homeostasis protein CutC [Pengzhenrongella sicca]QTE29666.1 copper homeostasis protein CutC [Pengzhenrongella sicca]